MANIIISWRTLPWSGDEAAYSSHEELYLAIYLKFSANMLGTSTMTLLSLAEAFGYSTTRSSLCRTKEKLIEYIDALVSRGDKSPYDPVVIKPPNKDLTSIRANSFFTLEVLNNTEQVPHDRYVSIDGDTFQKLYQAAHSNAVQPAQLVSFYLYLKNMMYTIAETRGCWKYRKAILEEHNISLNTYMKYRKILHDAKLIFFRQNMSRDKPTLFALNNSEETWIKLSALTP